MDNIGYTGDGNFAIEIDYGTSGLVIPPLPSAGEDSHTTMTPEQYDTSKAKGAETKNTAIYQMGESILEGAKDVMSAIQNAPSAIKNGITDTYNTIAGSYKAIIAVGLFAGVSIAAYYALNIAATTKRNLKTLKA
jgi:hypothetical protein